MRVESPNVADIARLRQPSRRRHSCSSGVRWGPAPGSSCLPRASRSAFRTRSSSSTRIGMTCSGSIRKVCSWGSQGKRRARRARARSESWAVPGGWHRPRPANGIRIGASLLRPRLRTAESGQSRIPYWWLPERRIVTGCIIARSCVAAVGAAIGNGVVIRPTAGISTPWQTRHRGAVLIGRSTPRASSGRAR